MPRLWWELVGGAERRVAGRPLQGAAGGGQVDAGALQRLADQAAGEAPPQARHGGGRRGEWGGGQGTLQLTFELTIIKPGLTESLGATWTAGSGKCLLIG